MNILNILNSPWFYVPVFFICWVTFFMIVKTILFRWVKKLTRYTETKLDDVFLQAAKLPFTILIVSSGGALAEKLAPQPVDVNAPQHFLTIFKAITIVALVIFVERFLSGIMRLYAERVEILRTSGAFASGVVRVVVYGLGLLALMDSFGISITPALASLGIGSLAVALSLQPTMENFFAGIQLVVDKPIQPGQFIKLESGEEGYVHHIGWRSTWIRLPPNNVIIVPNKFLTSTRIVNYYYPEPEMSVPVTLAVHYNSDLDQVERVTLEVAQEVLRETEGGVPSFTPAVRFTKFGDYSVDLVVVLRTQEISQSANLVHHLIKRLKKRYEAEGIVIPYPVQAVNTLQEDSVNLNSRERKS